MTHEPADTVLTQIVMAKLSKMFGEVQAKALSNEVLGPLPNGQIQTADELKGVANALISKGGLTKMIGHSLMMEAMLRGAKQ